MNAVATMTMILPEYPQAERLKNLLLDWADWCHGCGTRLGYDSRSAGIGFSRGDDFESLLGKIEAQVCRMIDTAIEDLPIDQKCAIHHRYLASVYRFRNYAQSLGEAHDRLLVVLPRKGVVI